MSSNEVASAGTASTPGPAPRARYGLVDGAVLKAIGAVLRHAPAGRLHVTLPSGRSALVGPADREATADVALSSYRAVWRAARRGALGFAEGYMDGDLDSSDLEALFNYFLDNEEALVRSSRRVFHSRWADRVLHRRRANTRTGSRRNIAAHYDLGNDFYRLWLDEGMTYSSGIYASAGDGLDTAQRTKYEHILAALQIAPGQRVLEIGCGWGGFAEAAARAGADVTGITISEQQRAWATNRIGAAGLDDRVRIRFEDYRDTTGTFDHIASIEMIEAVGEENWRAYFDVLSRRLAPQGTAVIQAITIRPDLYESYRHNPDFIQRYVFPGGMLPTEDAMLRNAEQAGLTYERLETFGASYALTLADWRRRFNAAWPCIAAQGFDDRFRRMWLYYLAYCQVGFERGLIDVGLYRFGRKS